MTDDDRKPVRKIPRKVTPAYLQRAAMAYLER
jgi:regulatory protein